MTIVIDGTTGISGVDGTASNPSYEGTDSNTGIFYPAADTVAIGTGGTEALRVNSAQNVGIGITSPVHKLNVAGDIFIQPTTLTTASLLRVNNTGGTLFIGRDNSTGSNFGAAYASVFWSQGAYPIQFATNDAERARITSSGNLAIGTAVTTNFGDRGLYVSGNGGGYTAVAVGASGNDYGVIGYNVGFTPTAGTYKAIATDGMSWIRFTNAGFEFWRQTSATGGTDYTGTQGMTLANSGALLVGVATNAENYRTNIQFPGNGTNGLLVQNTASSGAPTFLGLVDTAQSLNNTNDCARYNDTAATRWVLRKNGGLANFQANNVNLSDRREKTNFSPAKDYLDVICAIPVQTFNYIDQAEDDPGLTLGVVAQDVQAVAPELISESDWGTPEEPKMRLSIYQTDLQYALMKCIQELKAELDATKAEIAALKGTA